MRLSSSSGLTMMNIAQICASRNSSASTHAALTSFHVRALLALRAASTACWYSVRWTRHEARRLQLELDVKSTFAASYMPSL